MNITDVQKEDESVILGLKNMIFLVYVLVEAEEEDCRYLVSVYVEAANRDGGQLFSCITMFASVIFLLFVLEGFMCFI